jgi:hypothetical protein
MEWAPGGDIMVITMNLLTGSWGPPQLVYALEEDQGIPKVSALGSRVLARAEQAHAPADLPGRVALQVTANKLLVLANGDWILPFWRERALLGFGPACR